MREIDAYTEKITELPPHGNTSPTTYPSLIHRGTNVYGRSAIYRKWIAVESVLDEQKCKLQKHESTVISTTCTRVSCFLCGVVSVDQIVHGKCDGRTVIFTMILYRSLVSESSVTGLGVYSGWWMYDNITLHSLCYLARVRPVIPTPYGIL